MEREDGSNRRSRLDTRCISKAMLLPRVLFRDHTESKGEEISYLKKLHGYVLDNASRTRTASRLFNLSGLSWRYLSTTLTASPKVIAECLQTFLEVLITPSTTPRQYPASKPCVAFLQDGASSFPSNLSVVSSFTANAVNENKTTKAIKHMR